jgi:sensor histidine kinase YesM
MLNYSLIFSEKRDDRIKRHLLFWGFWWFYFGLMHAVQPFGAPEIAYFRNLPFTISESILLMLPQMALTYPMLYFVLPRFIFNDKYLKAFLWTIVFILLAGVVSFLMGEYVNPKVLAFILPDQYLKYTQRPPALNFAMGVLVAIKGAPLCAAIAVGLKLLKHWYVKEKRNMQLLKENAEAQLQLLTAQVHPHFLFNTLNNIYSQVQNESPKGSKMIMGLSDLMRYILSEGNKTAVPLSKELTMLNEYINLEKVRYGNKLELHISMPQETGNLQIAPLLLLPFVENCFKHGTSKFLIHPWINLKIELKGKTMIMKLMNGKETQQVEETVRSGTGVLNVKKRLELLYKDKYELQISDEQEIFVVNLKIELTEGKPESKKISESITTFDYA